MSERGRVFDWERTGEGYEITGAVISDNRISIDWTEGGDDGHLEASSTDGRFRGTFGYKKSGPEGTFELRRFMSGQVVLLFGTWLNPSGREGGWAFLIPGAARTQVSKKRALVRPRRKSR
jgi:hypothetical protein